ncbi:MAG: ATP-binding protein [Luteolibacter sp.]
MTESSFQKRLRSRFSFFAGWAVGLVVLIGLLVICGWLADIEGLKRLADGQVAMNPATAICFIFCGISLVAQFREGSSERYFARILGGTVTLFGLLILVGNWIGSDSRIDQVLFAGKLHLNEPGGPSRMAPNTALGFVLTGTALMIFDWKIKGGNRVAEWLAMLLGVLSLVALVGYAYQIEWLYGVSGYKPMALHTAAAFLLLALGMAFSRPGFGLMALVTEEGPGGLLVRRMFPLMLVVFLTLGGLRIAGERNGWYQADQGIVLYTVVVILIFGALLLWCARSIERTEALRKVSENALINLNAKLLRQTEMMEGVNQELETFSYSVSHDLRAPLRGIAGFALALEEHSYGDLDEVGRGYLKRVQSAAGRMGDLIDDLLKLSRLTRTEMKMEQVDISEIATAVVDDFIQTEPGRNVEIIVAPGIQVHGDASLLRILLENLIGNAWKFTSKTAAARIEIGGESSQNGRTTCFVKDNGAGFDMRNSHKLFSAFQRLHSQQEFPGIGIGLATVHRVVRRHGGEVMAQSEINHGATFKFVLANIPAHGTQNHNAGRGQPG